MTSSTSTKENLAVVNTIRNPIIRTTETITASISPERRICSPKTLLLSGIVAARSKTPTRMDSLGVATNEGKEKPVQAKEKEEEEEEDITEVLETKLVPSEKSSRKWRILLHHAITNLNYYSPQSTSKFTFDSTQISFIPKTFSRS